MVLLPFGIISAALDLPLFPLLSVHFLHWLHLSVLLNTKRARMHSQKQPHTCNENLLFFLTQRRVQQRNHIAVHEPCFMHSLNSTVHRNSRDGLPIVKEKHFPLQWVLGWLIPNKEELCENKVTLPPCFLKVISCPVDRLTQSQCISSFLIIQGKSRIDLSLLIFENIKVSSCIDKAVENWQLQSKKLVKIPPPWRSKGTWWTVESKNNIFDQCSLMSRYSGWQRRMELQIPFPQIDFG